MKKRTQFYNTLLVLLFLLINSVAFAQNNSHVVAYEDSGNDSDEPFLVNGSSYTFSSTDTYISQKVLSCSFQNQLIYAFDNVDINAHYDLNVTFFSDQKRVITIKADGNSVCPPIELKPNEERRVSINLPRKSYAYGQLVLLFEALEGPNAVVSEIELVSSEPTKLIPFSEDKKEELRNVKHFTLNKNIDVEAHLPVYTPIPSFVSEVYNPQLTLNSNWMFSNDDDSSNWEPIHVPGEWAMQEFKVDSVQWARYKTVFSIPRSWNSKRVMLRFDGVHSEYNVYVNDNKVGYHLGGMTPYEVDITPYLNAQGNRLLVEVRSESLADMLGSLTQYAAHQLGGITRKVRLFAVPDLHVSDLRVVTDLDDAYRDAQLKVFVKVKNSSKKDYTNASLRLMLEKYSEFSETSLPLIKANTVWQGWVNMEVKYPKLWDNEHPNLYNMTLSLYHNDLLSENIEKRVGFREVEVKGNQLFVNGKAVKLHGVCRHESHPLTGRTLSPEIWKKDVELYRNGNCNFIRTSHYPPAEEFIELCDEMGLFVEVEAPVCWIGHYANENWKTLNYKDSCYYPYVLQANMEMIHYYRNHPSVIFWSMANESYWNKEFAQIGEYMKKADSTRPYAFHDQAYGGFNSQGSTAPIANIHYPGPKGYLHAAKSNRPMTYGEFCHLNVYNRNELVTDPGVRSDWALALKPTWEKMYKTKGVLGGSIWSGIDDIFQLPDGTAVGYGAWGIIDGWRRPKPEYWDMKKIYSPIKVLTKKLDVTPEWSIDVENRYLFSNLDEVKICWTFGQESGYTSLSAEPGEVGTMKINVHQPDKANELSLRFIDKRGFVVDSYVIPVGDYTKAYFNDIPKVKTNLLNRKHQYLIQGKDFECSVNKVSGQILLKKNNKEVICGGPYLMALPLKGGGCFPNHNALTLPFNQLCSDWHLNQITAQNQNNSVVVTLEGVYKEFSGRYILTVNANGELTVEYAFKALVDVSPRQWGVVFDAPLSYNRLFWKRDGEWSVYPKNHIGRTSGEALLNYDIVPDSLLSRTPRTWDWSFDANQLGSNDFRAKRKNIWFAGLKSLATDQEFVVLSNGKQHWRSWLSDNCIRFLVADFDSPGNEMFLDSYYSKYRQPIKKGELIKGTVKLRVK